MKRSGETALVILFMFILFAVPVLMKFEKNTAYSTYENRTLAQVPVLSGKALISGDYFQDWDDYLSDHIVGRNELLRVYADLNSNILHKPVVNDVVILKDRLLQYNGYYTEDTAAISARIADMAQAVSGLNEHVSDSGGQFFYVGVPEQYSIFRGQYPAYLNSREKMLDFIETGFFGTLREKGVKYLDMRGEFLKEDDFAQYYSNIDHHYTYSGAFKTCQSIIRRVSQQTNFTLEAPKREDFDFIELPNPFYGSRNRKLCNVYASDEKLWIANPKTPVAFTRTDNGKAVDASLFALPQNDTDYVTYSVYMGGDVGETVIDTGRDALPNLLLFGDSFTNPLETIIYRSFNQTRVLDLRHYDEQSLYEYIDKYRPDVVVCLRDDTNYLTKEGNGTFE